MGVTQIIVFTLPWLNSYCPYASLRSNWHPRSHFFSTIWIFFSLPWFPIGCISISLFPNRSKSKNFFNSVTWLATNDLTLPAVLWPAWIPNQPSSRFSLSFFMCTPDYHPSSPARFKRSNTVKVKKFPLFKNFNKTPLIRHGHTVTIARPFLPPATRSFTLSKHPFIFCLYYALPPVIQFHLLFTFSPNTCATAIKSMIRSVHACTDSGGGHLEHLLWVVT